MNRCISCESCSQFDSLTVRNTLLLNVQVHSAQRSGSSAAAMAKRRLALLGKAKRETRAIEKRMLALTRQLAKTARRRRQRRTVGVRGECEGTSASARIAAATAAREAADRGEECAAAEVAVQLLSQSVRRMGHAQYARERLAGVERRRALLLREIESDRKRGTGASLDGDASVILSSTD